MGKNDNLDEEMTVELSLEDGTNVVCAIITILDVAGQDYIVLLPLDENGENEDVTPEENEDENVEPTSFVFENDYAKIVIR